MDDAPVWFIAGGSAGFGYQALVEEGDDAEIRAVFEANVFLHQERPAGFLNRKSGAAFRTDNLGGTL